MNAHSHDVTPEPAPERTRGRPDLDADARDTPGRRLRRAREAKRLEATRIATELRLTPRTIDAIERDDYANLPSPVFVAGYIRSYARLVELDPEPLLDAFRRLHPAAEPPPRIATGAGAGADTGAGGGWLAPVVGIAVVAALLGGAYLWWQNRGPLPEPMMTAEPPRDAAGDFTAEPPVSGIREPAPEIPASARAPAFDAPADGAGDIATADPMGDALGPPAPSAPADPALDEPQPPLPVPAPPEAPLAGSASAPSTASADRAEGEPEAAAGAAATPPEAAAADGPVAAADGAGAEATASGPEVVLTFSGPCWVDVRDATGDYKLFGEMGDGDRHVLGGEPPYSLIIGNAAAVEMEIGGEPFDVAAIARGNVARFNLDAADIAAAAADDDAAAAD